MYNEMLWTRQRYRQTLAHSPL